jgi:hypothetical protein
MNEILSVLIQHADRRADSFYLRYVHSMHLHQECLKLDNIYIKTETKLKTILDGSLVTTTWRVLGLPTEETASRYGW